MLEVRQNVSDKTLRTKEWILLRMKDCSVAYIFWKKKMWFLQQLVAGGVMMLYLFKTPQSSSIPGNTHSEVMVFTCFFSSSVASLLTVFWDCYAEIFLFCWVSDIVTHIFGIAIGIQSAISTKAFGIHAALYCCILTSMLHCQNYATMWQFWPGSQQVCWIKSYTERFIFMSPDHRKEFQYTTHFLVL